MLSKREIHKFEEGEKNRNPKSHLEIPGRFQYQNGNKNKVSRGLGEKKIPLRVAEKDL